MARTRRSPYPSWVKADMSILWEGKEERFFGSEGYKGFRVTLDSAMAASRSDLAAFEARHLPAASLQMQNVQSETRQIPSTSHNVTNHAVFRFDTPLTNEGKLEPQSAARKKRLLYQEQNDQPQKRKKPNGYEERRNAYWDEFVLVRSLPQIPDVSVEASQRTFTRGPL
ncbi:hypothetical protein RSAG8_12639, partial [Rhizoctonia solani AG-8 WAC10335]